MIQRRTLFEQPVIIVTIVSHYLVVGALFVLPWAAVTAAQDVTSGQQQGQGEGGGSQQPPHQHRPLCPDGWVRGFTGGQSFKDKDAGLCLYLSPKALSWSEARKACRTKDSVLLSLDTALSVEERLFPQYLKDKGVGEVWTGMHKSAGRQIWDEPGKEMVKAYRGSQRTIGETKRGWTWDIGTFSDARLTCGLYSYSSDQPHSGSSQQSRRRRDTDTPSPGAVASRSSGNPGREDSQGGLKGGAPSIAAFKSFLSSQGMKSFATKLSDKVPEKARDDVVAKSVSDQVGKKTGSTQVPPQTPEIKGSESPASDKTKDSQSDKKNDQASDKTGSGVKDMDSVSNDSPSDDKNNNSTTDHPSSDEDDSNHELKKRSTPFGYEMTTANPGELRNVTELSNGTQNNILATPTTTTGTTTVNGTASPALSGQDPSLKNGTASSAGLFSDNPGFSKEILGFFNTDSKDSSASGGSPPASQPKTDTHSRETPIQDSLALLPRPLTPQEFIKRFQTGSVEKMGGAGESSTTNNTKDVGSAVAMPASDQDMRAVVQVNNTATGTETQQGMFGGAAVAASNNSPTPVPAPTTAAPTNLTTTPDASSEESTDSSQEASTTTATPAVNKGQEQGLFSNSGLASSSTSSPFQQRFGPSSSSSGVESATQRTTTSDSGEETTTTTTTTRMRAAENLLPQKSGTLTFPASTTTPGHSTASTAADNKEVTPQSDSAEVTPKPDSKEVTSRPDTKLITSGPDSKEVTSDPLSKEVTSRPDSKEITSQPDSAEVTPGPDSAVVTPRLDSAEVTPRPDSAEFTPRPDSAEVTPRPDSAEVTPRPDSAEVTPRPDSAEVTPRPGSTQVTPGSDSQEATSQATESSQEVTGRQDSQAVSVIPSSPKTTQISTTNISSQEDVGGSLFSGVSPRTQNTTPSTRTLLRESSEELDHVTEETTMAQHRSILQSMTPRPGDVLPSAGNSWMTLQNCQQPEQFVCAAKPVHDFTPLPQCGEGWLGHSLVSRCYRLEWAPASYEQALRRCQNLGGSLASVDTVFFANVTHLYLERIRLLQGFTSPVWIEKAKGLAQLCSVIEAQVPELQTRACHLSLPYLCQKAAVRPSSSANRYNNSHDDDDDNDRRELEKPSIIMNMSSWNPQNLLCPVGPLLQQDIVIWFKDGQPVPSDATETPSSSALPLSSSSRNPAVLQLNMQLLQRLGVRPSRMLQPALLQGIYWCRVWRQNPLRSVTSDRVYVRFLDVVTLQGFLKTTDISLAEAAFFNEMGDSSSLPAAIGRGLQLMNDRIYPRMQRSQPFLSDIITTIQTANAETEEVEFRTYLCLSTSAMAPQDKGAVVDAYLKVLHTELVASEDLIRRDWNLSTSLEQAFRLLMTEMCPESKLLDKVTGNEATFGSTPVNQQAVSLESCDGMFTGYAMCRGDLISGAYWAQWYVDLTCSRSANTESAESDKTEEDKRPKVDPAVVVETGKGVIVPQKPNSDLLNIDEVHIEQENVGDVSDRLAAILNTSVVLTNADVEIVADVIARVALVPVLPQDVGFTLLKTVNRVLDTPLTTLHQAQRNTQASTRILQDLDKFSEKLQFGQNDHVRYVMPNVAMEVWNLRAARKSVIGLAAIVGQMADSPLMESRIMTLSNRSWTDLHMGSLDVAIELPDQLVSREGLGNGRLSMTIYRKPGLFLSSLSAQGHNPQDNAAVTELNSAIISATLASTTVRGLEDSVKLIFRPLKAPAAGQPTRCVYWDFSLPFGGGWSSRGCAYNGTLQGRDICLCDHLTNFAVLLDFYGDREPVDEVHTAALSIITIIGLSLSILGLSLTVITFIFFKKLRQGRAHQTLFHMALALLCSEVVLLAGLKQTAHDGVCLAVAVLLHYFILASFLWMLVEAVLQYLTFVKVLGTYISKYTLKTVLPAWTIPLIPVIAVLATDYTQYRGRRDYCWMSLDAFYYAFALPVGMIILFNIVTFIVIMFSLLRRPEGLRSTRNKSNTTETNIKAAFTIFVLLGLTWTFGYLAIADARLPFQYMFTVSSSLQGFLIFVLLVARRRQFREQWRALCCKRVGQARGQKITPTLSNSASSQSSTSSSFTFSSRSRSSSGSSSKTLDVLIKRADSNASRGKVEVSSPASTRSRQC